MIKIHLTIKINLVMILTKKNIIKCNIREQFNLDFTVWPKKITFTTQIMNIFIFNFLGEHHRVQRGHFVSAASPISCVLRDFALVQKERLPKDEPPQFDGGGSGAAPRWNWFGSFSVGCTADGHRERVGWPRLYPEITAAGRQSFQSFNSIKRYTT